MDEPPLNDSRQDDLPVEYVNPWRSLSINLRSVLADLKLRGIEILRLNSTGTYPTPKFLPSTFKIIFWPFILTGLLILLFFGAFNKTWSNLNPIYLPETDLTIDSLLNESSFGQASQVIDESGNEYSNEINYPIVDPNQDSRKISQNDLSIMSLLDEDLPSVYSNKNLIEFIDTISLDNGVIIQVGNIWNSLTPNEFISIILKLDDHLKILGYEEVKVFDKNGLLIARDSKISSEMIFFEQALG